MHSFELVPTPILGNLSLTTLNHQSPLGVTMRERSTVSLCNVIARKGAANQLANRVRQEFGIELPQTPRYERSGPVSFIWASPNQWLAMADNNESQVFEQRLRSLLTDTASIMDQSDGRTVIRISGPRARDALAKGVLIDLHPSAFRSGDTAISTAAYINVHFWQIDDVPTYEFAIFRSFAVAFCEWLSESSAEYGVAHG